MAETLALYNDWQRDFPLVPHPFAHLAAAHHTTEATVLAQLAAGLDKGEISRIGAVFAPNRIGVSTLAALAVPPNQLEAVAAQVNQHPEVNHNYARAGHRFNLWFVLTARHRAQLDTVLDTLRHTTRRPLLDLPLVREYHIDLGFSLTGTAPARPAVLPTPAVLPPPVPPTLTAQDWGLIAALEAGLPLVHAPYAALGQACGLHEVEVLARLAAWQTAGWLRRFGVVLRHRALGYRANAMCVWDVPDALVDAKGAWLAQQSAVNLCYRRPRRAGWAYSLFAMLHGRDAEAVSAQAAKLTVEGGLQGYAHHRLFSTHCYRQRGAQYAAQPAL